jgi:hypothetical protein
VGWTGHAASIGWMREVYSIIFGTPEDMRITGKLGIYGRIILKWN